MSTILPHFTCGSTVDICNLQLLRIGEEKKKKEEERKKPQRPNIMACPEGGHKKLKPGLVASFPRTTSGLETEQAVLYGSPGADGALV